MTALKVAIISPSKNVTSETFIRAHIAGIRGEVFHYYNGYLPKNLDGHGELLSLDIMSRVRRKFSADKELSPDEQVLKASLSQNHIEVVLAEYGPTGAAMTAICETLNIPLVVHFHGYDVSQYDILKKYGSSYKLMFSKAAAIIAVSHKMSQMLQEQGADADKIHLLPYGPDPALMKVHRDSNATPQFLSVGRFVDKKAPYYVLLAFKELIDSGIQARLTMVGDGPLYATVRNLIGFYKLEDHVSLTGAIDHTEVKALMATSDCFIQHSVRPLSGDMEGLPVSILEAAAAGLQVISTRHAGIPDLIVHDETGFLVDEHDVSGMAEYMKRSVAQPTERDEMGATSRKRIAAQFSRESNLKKLNDLLISVCTGR